jgi:tetratricopeptide (TPR) repeat protein
MERDLAKARQLLDQPRPDLDQALPLIDKLLNRIERYADRAAEIHLLAGWAHARAGSKAAAGEALDHWRQARDHLEQAQTLGVLETERLRLTCLLGKAWYQTQGDLHKVIDYLEASVEQADDDPPEGYSVLTQAYLRLPTPDVAAALRANEKQLEWPGMDEDVLAPARLLRGELLLQLHRPNEARKVLEHIGDQAAPEIRAHARILEAGSYQADEHANWTKAAELWNAILTDTQAPARLVASALYNLGVCYRNLNQLAEAERRWRECAERADGSDDAQAASLRLAEVRLADNDAPAALEAFERAARSVQSPADWHNSLIDLTSARQAFERGCLACRNGGDYDSAIQLARVYEKLAPPGAAQELRGQAAEAWGRLKKEQAAKKPGGRELEDALALFRQAGEAYQRAGELAPVPDARIDRLWLSAACFVQGQDPTRALPVLEMLVKQPLKPARLGEAWYLLAETRRALKDEPAALDAYLHCIEYPSVFALRARYELAMAEVSANHIDAARSALEQNLDLLQDDRDPEALEKTLSALADLLFAGGDYLAAEVHLKRVLQTFPDSPEVLRRRLRLADCNHLLAAKEVKTFREGGPSLPDIAKKSEEQYRALEEKAAELYQEVSDALGKLKVGKGLDKEQEAMFLHTAFGTAECRYNLGDYPQAIGLYQQLQSYYQGKAEELNALAGLARCYWSQGGPEGARKALQEVDKIRTLLATLKDAELDRGAGSWDRQKWEEWLRDVMRRSEQP